MYLPAHFAESRAEELHRVITQHPLGALVHQGPQGLDANHIPFLLDAAPAPHGTLLAHVARANALWQEVTDGAPVLVIFRAASAYISPNWYPSKPETHRHVPTWNYQAVHVHGTLHIRHDEPFLRGVVARLCKRAPYTHVVRYRRPTAAFAGDVETLLDAPSYGLRWVLIVPSGARPAP